MKGKKTSHSDQEIDFIETGQEDIYMKEVFEDLNKIPDKEIFDNQKKFPKKNKKPKNSPFSSLIGPDDQIDLHGKTREESIIIVEKFIKLSINRDLQNILIITGKGHNSGQTGPVLKNYVEKLLKTIQFKTIKKFYDAPNKYGGSGAIWIELN